MYLIINLGLKSIRFIVFDDNAKVIYSDSRPIHTILKNERVEQDAYEWKNLLFELLNKLSLNQDLIKNIKYITSTASSSCVFGLNKEMEPITKVLMVSDKRASRESNEIKNNSIFIKHKNNSQISCSVSSNIPKLLWFKNNELVNYEKIKHWIGANEFLNYEFTGEVFTDCLNASKSFFSENSKKYYEDILADLSIPLDLLPEVKPIGSIYNLDHKFVNKFSFNKDCKYILTSYDAVCAVIGSHTGEEGDVCDVSGTVTSVRTLADNDINLKNKTGLLLKQNIDSIEKSIVGSSNNLGGGIIEWYKQTFFTKDNDLSYDNMINESKLSSPGANGLIFLPFLLGERSPFMSNDIKASFFGISRDTSKNDFTKAVFESTAYVTMDLLSSIRNEGLLVKNVCVGGGLARIDEVNQIKADVINLPIKVLKNFESTSLGAFILLRLSLNHFNSLKEATIKLVKVKNIIYPNKTNFKIYSESYKLYKKITRILLEVSKSSLNNEKLTKYISDSKLKNL